MTAAQQTKPVLRWLQGWPRERLSICGASLTMDGVGRVMPSHWCAIAAFEACAATLGEAALVPFEQETGASDLIALGARDFSEGEVLVVSVQELESASFHETVRDLRPYVPPGTVDVPPWFFARHLFRQLARAGHSTFELRLWLAERFIEPVLEDIAAFELADSVSELELSSVWNSETNAVYIGRLGLGGILPSLRMLTVPWWLWDRVGAVRYRSLERLTLEASFPSPTEPPPPAQVLTTVARDCPRLRELILDFPLTVAVLRSLREYRLAQRLQLIELRGSLGNKPRGFYDALLRAEGLLAEADRIRVREPERASQRVALAQWPAIEFTDFVQSSTEREFEAP